MDYTQEDVTQLDPHQQGPLEQDHEIRFQSDSEESEDGIEGGITRSGAQYLLLGMELAALNLEEAYTKRTCKLGTAEAKVAELQFRDSVMEQEELILFSLTKTEKLYTNVERAFDYKNSQNE